MDQKMLIIRAQQGDTNSFALAVQQIQDRSFRIAYSYLHDEGASMDAVCDAVEKALINIKKLRDPDKFNTWFTRIVINQCKIYLRKTKSLVYTEDEEMMGFAASPLTDEMLDLHALLDKQPPLIRMLIQMKYVQGYTLEEIAEMTDMPLGTVKTKIYNTIKLFKQQMVPEIKEAGC